MWKVLDARALQEELTSGSDIVAGELLRANKGVVETPRERTSKRKAVSDSSCDVNLTTELFQ